MIWAATGCKNRMALSGCIGISASDTPASPSVHAAFSLGFADKPYSWISSYILRKLSSESDGETVERVGMSSTVKKNPCRSLFSTCLRKRSK
jgi:hypothetical protein